MDTQIKRKATLVRHIVEILPQLNQWLTLPKAVELLQPIVEEFRSVYCVFPPENCPVALKHIYKLALTNEQANENNIPAWGYANPEEERIEINVANLFFNINYQSTPEEIHEKMVYNFIELLTTLVHEHQHNLQYLLNLDEIPEEEKKELRKLIPLATEIEEAGDNHYKPQAKAVLEYETILNPDAKELTPLSEDEIEQLAQLWYLDGKMEIDARDAERKWLADFYSDLITLRRDNLSLVVDLFQNDQTKQSLFLLETETNKSLTFLTKSEANFNANKASPQFDTISSLMSPQIVIDRLISRASQALCDSYKIMSYSTELAHANSEEFNLLVQRRALLNKEVAQALFAVCKKFDNVYNLSAQQLYWKLIQNGLIEVAKEFEQLVGFENPSFLEEENDSAPTFNREEKNTIKEGKGRSSFFDSKVYFQLLSTQDISLETLQLANKLDANQIATLITKFTLEGKWGFVEELCNIASVKKGLKLTDSELKKPFIDAMASKLQTLLSLPIEKVDFDQIDQMLNLLFNVGLSCGFQSILATATPPKEEQLKQFHSLFSQCHQLAHLKASSMAGRVLSSDEFRFGYASDRRAYLSSKAERQEKYRKTYGEIEYRRKLLDIESAKSVSSVAGYEEDFESY